MPAWIHDRAERLLSKNPSMQKSTAFAIATQQSHALGKTPKGYGTKKGKEVAKNKYDTPGDDQKTAQRYRQINDVLLDETIPIVNAEKDPIGTISKAIDEGKGKKTNWSHFQVAVPKEQLDVKGQGFEKTRLAIPLPGESWLSHSYRHGELHAHDFSPFYLVHKDAVAPEDSALRHFVHDVPQALGKRLSGKVQPFVKKVPMNNQQEKAAMEAFAAEYKKLAFTTSQYAGPMGTIPFQQASQIPSFKVPSLRTPVEKPAQKIATALTPAGRLVATQRKGTGMGASVRGPSIASVAKPPGMGSPMPGALKNQI